MAGVGGRFDTVVRGISHPMGPERQHSTTAVLVLGLRLLHARPVERTPQGNSAPHRIVADKPSRNYIDGLWGLIPRLPTHEVLPLRDLPYGYRRSINKIHQTAHHYQRRRIYPQTQAWNLHNRAALASAAGPIRVYKPRQVCV